MKHSFLTFSASLLITLAPLAASAETSSERTVVGPRGNTVNVERSTTRTDGGSSTVVERSANNRTGNNRQINRIYDPATGTYTRQVTGTTANGGTWTSERSTVCVDGSCYRDGVYVGPAGNTSVMSGTATRIAPGAVEGTVTRTGPQGRSVTTQRVWRRIRGNN